RTHLAHLPAAFPSPARGLRLAAFRRPVQRSGRAGARSHQWKCETPSFPRHSSSAQRTRRVSMNTCLRNRTLLLLWAGEGTSEQQAQLASCTACAIRYRQFVHDLEAIERVLRTTSPFPAPSPYRFSIRLHWLPTMDVATYAERSRTYD